MASVRETLKRFASEVRRRRVLRALAFYVVGAWIVIQVSETTFPYLGVGDGWITLVIVVLIAGLPLAAVLSWVFDLTSRGLQRTPREPDAVEAGEEPRPDSDPALPAPGAPLSCIDPANIRSMAVLPFVDLSPEGDQEYFSDGITEELIHALGSLESLRVSARSSSFAFKGREEDVRTIGTKLGVEAVLEGSVRKSGNTVRITVQIVCVEDGFHLWTRRFEEELCDIFAIQGAIAREVVEVLRIKPSAEEQRALTPAFTSNLEAYEFYLRGMALFRSTDRERVERSTEMFRKAIEADPTYAPAYAGLCEAHSLLFVYFNPDPAHLKAAAEAGDRAIALGSEIAEVQAACGFALSLQDRFSEAEECLNKALELNPRLFEAHYFSARAAVAQGRLEKAAEEFEAAYLLRPEDHQPMALLMGVYRSLGDMERARSAARRALESIVSTMEIDPGNGRAAYHGAGAWAFLGEEERAREWIDRALKLIDDGPAHYNVACALATLGDEEQAMHHLKQAVERGFCHPKWLENDPDLAAVRGHPLFPDLLEQMEGRLRGD